MIWFFSRDDRHIGVRIRRDPDDAGYELVTSHPDGSEQVVVVENASALIGCALELQAGPWAKAGNRALSCLRSAHRPRGARRSCCTGVPRGASRWRLRTST